MFQKMCTTTGFSCFISTAHTNKNGNSCYSKFKKIKYLFFFFYIFYVVNGDGQNSEQTLIPLDRTDISVNNIFCLFLKIKNNY